MREIYKSGSVGVGLSIGQSFPATVIYIIVDVVPFSSLCPIIFHKMGSYLFLIDDKDITNSENNLTNN
jgi:hypothetical protein